MNTATKLTAFAAAVAVAFGGAMAVGAAVGPIDVGGDTGHEMTEAAPAGLPRGLAIAQDGYRLVTDTTILTAGLASSFGLRIVDGSGAAVTAFDELHERQLHLVIVSRNLVDYLHLHPTMAASGQWSVEAPALAPGSYRVFADFQPTGADNLTLAADLTVAGEAPSIDLPMPATVSEVDGYEVALSGAPRVGESELGFDVRLGGAAVRTDPYLGAAGHLVAIRTGDLAYLHVHPHEDDASTTVTFTVELPSAGTYRLFLDFTHGGEVRTAAFTVVVPEGH